MTQFTPPTAGMLSGFDMRGALTGILSGDSDLAREHQAEKARTLPSPGSAAWAALSPEEQEAVERERQRRREVARRQRAEYIESVGGYGNYEGGFNDADYWNAGYASMDGTYWYDGQMYDGSAGNDPTGGNDHRPSGGLGAGHWQGGFNPNQPDNSGGVAGGGAGGGSGGGSGGGGTSTVDIAIGPSTPFLDAYMRAKADAEREGPVDRVFQE